MKKWITLILFLIPFPSLAGNLTLNKTTATDTTQIVIQDCHNNTAGKCDQANYHFYPNDINQEFYCAKNEEGGGTNQAGTGTGCDWDNYGFINDRLRTIFDSGQGTNNRNAFYLAPGIYQIWETSIDCFGETTSTCASGNTIYASTTITIQAGGNTTSTFYTTVMSTSTDAIVGNVFNALYLLLWFFFFIIVFWVTFKITKR